MSTQTVSLKRCVHCAKDVTHEKRMKDSVGRYWCLDCGTADQKKKATVAAMKSHELARHPKSAGNGGKLIKMLAIFGLLTAVAVWRFMH